MNYEMYQIQELLNPNTLREFSWVSGHDQEVAAVPCLDDESGDVVDLDPDGLAHAGRNEDLGAGGGVHAGTEVGTWNYNRFE